MDKDEMPFEYSLDELQAAVRYLDGQVEAGRFEREPVDAILRFFHVDPDAMMDVSSGRAMLVCQNLPSIRPKDMAQGIELIAALAASWMDGFCAALYALREAQEDSP